MGQGKKESERSSRWRGGPRRKRRGQEKGSQDVTGTASKEEPEGGARGSEKGPGGKRDMGMPDLTTSRRCCVTKLLYCLSLSSLALVQMLEHVLK